MDVLPTGFSDNAIAKLVRLEVQASLSGRRWPGFFHSWVETGKFIVDYHTNMRLSASMCLYSVLILKEKDELATKAVYTPNGGEFNFLGKQMIYTLPAVLTQLRL